MNPTRKVWYDKNNVPPTNYIWYKNGKYLENIDGKWVESGGMNNSGSGIKPDMTEAEQMQARKDLGLYYEETTTGEKTVVSDGVQDSKLSDDAPSKDAIVNLLNPENESVEYTITDIENGYQIKTQLEDGNNAVFYVITDGDSKGIFDSGAFYGMGYELVYNGPITTISKVPERFLPEQESGLPWLDLTGGLDIPSDGNNINLSSMISQADWEKLLAGEYAGIHTPENISSFIFEHHRPILSCSAPASYSAKCVFLGDSLVSGFDVDNAINRIIVIAGNNIDSVSIRRITIPTGNIPGPLTLSDLPTASMTTQAELDAIGLTNDVIVGLYSGNYTGIKYSDTSVIMNSKFVFAPFKTAQRTLSSGNVNTTLSFDILGNNYNIGIVQVVGGSTTVTVTVTPLS